MKLSLSAILCVCVLAAGAAAQSKRTSAAKKPAAKKTETRSKDARKESKTKATAKKDTRNTKSSTKDKTTARRNEARSDSKRDKLTAKSKTAEKDKKKLNPKKAAESKRAEAARRKAEEERRRAAIAEQRRREQAAREARERRLAFERGLRTETAENILNDNTEGEDLNVRRAAVGALGSRAGTVVVMEAKTGKLLTVVNQKWAIREGFKPCSTIKLVTGVAGINEEVIAEDGGIGSSGMKLDYALAKSNNGYFQRVGSSVGNAKMIEYSRKLGLGQPTGINAEGESPGKLPYGNGNARIYSHGDDFEVTPLQLAVMVSAIANGGKKVVPQMPRPRIERTAFRERPSSRVDLPRESVEGVLPGMVGAAEYGTARRGVDAMMGVAGKTGSCIGKGSWVGLFASVAPVEDPKYAVVVITRGQGERGKYAAAIAGQVYNALRPQIKRDPESFWAKRQMKPAQVDNATVAAGDEEEDEAVSETEAAGNEAPIVVGRTVQQPAVPAVRKMVQKTSQSKPTFKPVIIEYDRSGAEKKQRPRIVKN